MWSWLTASIFVAEVGESPDVGEIHGEPDDGEEEVHLAGPCLSPFSLHPPRNYTPCNSEQHVSHRGQQEKGQEGTLGLEISSRWKERAQCMLREGIHNWKHNLSLIDQVISMYVHSLCPNLFHQV